jgi:hypothetical protein
MSYPAHSLQLLIVELIAQAEDAASLAAGLTAFIGWFALRGL